MTLQSPPGPRRPPSRVPPRPASPIPDRGPDPRGARPHEAVPAPGRDRRRRARREPAGDARRVRRAHGAVRLGQEHAAPAARRPRPPDRRRGVPRGRGDQPAVRRRGDAPAPRAHRASCSSRSTSCRCSTSSRTSACRSRSPARTRGRASWPARIRDAIALVELDRQGAPPAGPAVGGRAAARRRRARDRHPARAPVRRRADRQPRLHGPASTSSMRCGGRASTAARRSSS